MSITREQAKDMVGKGWGKLVDKFYDAKPTDVIVSDVKEKYGWLRFYYYNSTTVFDDLADSIEKESSYICDQCGKEGENKEMRGWYSTLCYDCREELRDKLAKEYKEFMEAKENKISNE